MVDLNSVTLSGRVTADSVQRMTNSGKELTTFAIACNDDYKNKNTGEWVNRAYFFNCVLWKPMLLKKGEPVIVYGKLETNTEEYNGEKRTYIKISMTLNLSTDRFRQLTMFVQIKPTAILILSVLIILSF